MLIPESVKIKIACCKMDYKIMDLKVVVDKSFINKLSKINKWITKQENKPHIVIFPEGCGCDKIYSYARSWAKKYKITIVCGTSVNTNKIITSKIIYPKDNGYSEEEVEKLRPSPYDSILYGDTINNGKYNKIFTVNLPDNKSFKMKVLICYDFRFVDEIPKSFNDAQLLIVPMLDRAYEEAESIAYDIAKKYLFRIILLNKPTTNNIKIRTKKFNGKKKLFSCAVAPMNPSEIEYLKRSKIVGFDAKTYKIWRINKESIISGDYEIKQYASYGHYSAYGAGYFYQNITVFPL